MGKGGERPALIPQKHTATSAVEGEGALYDVDTVALRRRKELFCDVKRRYPWDTYLTGYLALAAYAVCATCAWLRLVAGGSLLWCLPYGWAIYCLWMVGHESYHHTMAPSAVANEWLGYLTMDCLVNSRTTWQFWHHHVHHGHTLGEEPHQDRQRLFGPCVLVETANIVLTVLQYWWWDVVDVCRAPTPSKFAGIVIKYAIMLQLPLNALVGYVFSLAAMANYMALLTHAAACHAPTTDGVVRQLRTSVDIFPSSRLCVFVTGALNSHCVHHVFPALPRALHPAGAARLARLFPDEYRAVHDFSTLAALWVVRHETFTHVVEMKDLVRLANGRWLRQCGLDVASVALLVAVTAAMPATTLF